MNKNLPHAGFHYQSTITTNYHASKCMPACNSVTHLFTSRDVHFTLRFFTWLISATFGLHVTDVNIVFLITSYKKLISRLLRVDERCAKFETALKSQKLIRRPQEIRKDQYVRQVESKKGNLKFTNRCLVYLKIDSFFCDLVLTLILC